MVTLALAFLWIAFVGSLIYSVAIDPLSMAARHSRDIARRKEWARLCAEQEAERAARPKPPVERTIILGEPGTPQRRVPLL